MSHNISNIHYILHNKEKLEKLYCDSCSMNEVARKLGCGETIIHKWIHRLGIKPKPRPATQRGKYVSKSTREKLSYWAKQKLGNKNPNWRNGSTPKNMLIRGRQWRERRRLVLARDNYECVECGSDFKLHIHHIKKVSEFPELVNDLGNLQTLCAICHRKIHFPKANLANSVKAQVVNAELSSNRSWMETNAQTPRIFDKCVETIHETVSNN